MARPKKATKIETPVIRPPLFKPQITPDPKPEPKPKAAPAKTDMREWLVQGEDSKGNSINAFVYAPEGTPLDELVETSNRINRGRIVSGQRARMTKYGR